MTNSKEMADVFEYISIPTANKNLIKITGTVTKEGHDFITKAVSNRDALVDALQFAIDHLKEINPSNYNHDDVCELNNASVEVALACKKAIAGAAS